MSIEDNCKPSCFVHGDNFHIFCQRFVQYVTLNKLETFLDVRFLSLVDNRTHSQLLDAKISDDDKSCPHKLVAAYEKAMYLRFSDSDIMSELFAIEQKSGETISDLIYKINITTGKSCNLTNAVIEKCKIAALCNAVNDQSIQTELRKSRNLNWKEAVEIVQIMEKPVKSSDHEIKFVNIQRDGDETVRGSTRVESTGEAGGHGLNEQESARGPRVPRGTAYHQLTERKFFKPLHCYVCGKRNHKAKQCHYRFQNRHQSNYIDHFRSKFRNSRHVGRRPMRDKGHESTDQINSQFGKHNSSNRHNFSNYNRFDSLDNDTSQSDYNDFDDHNLYGYSGDKIQNTASLNC